MGIENHVTWVKIKTVVQEKKNYSRSYSSSSIHLLPIFNPLIMWVPDLIVLLWLISILIEKWELKIMSLELKTSLFVWY